MRCPTAEGVACPLCKCVCGVRAALHLALLTEWYILRVRFQLNTQSIESEGFLKRLIVLLMYLKLIKHHASSDGKSNQDLPFQIDPCVRVLTRCLEQLLPTSMRELQEVPSNDHGRHATNLQRENADLMACTVPGNKYFPTVP